MIIVIDDAGVFGASLLVFALAIVYRIYERWVQLGLVKQIARKAT